MKYLLPSMRDHVIWCITYHRCHMYFSYIDAWWYITYHRCIVMSYDTSPTIYAWSYHMIHHLQSMHDHVIWYMVLSSPTIDAWSCHIIHHLPSMHGHVKWNISYHRCHMYFSFHRCMVIHHLPSMHSHVIWHITYSTIFAWSYHLIHHLP